MDLILTSICKVNPAKAILAIACLPPTVAGHHMPAIALDHLMSNVVLEAAEVINSVIIN